MCLHLKTGEERIKVSKGNITCYKVLFRTIGGDYHTPVQGYPIKHDVVDGSVELYAIGPRNVHPARNFLGLETIVEGGFIHTYATKKDLDDNINFIRKVFCTAAVSYEAFKCVIPKGTEYYKGVDDSRRKSYASNCIKFVKKVKI
jgi:hypothetical protein